MLKILHLVAETVVPAPSAIPLADGSDAAVQVCLYADGWLTMLGGEIITWNGSRFFKRDMSDWVVTLRLQPETIRKLWDGEEWDHGAIRRMISLHNKLDNLTVRGRG